MIYTPSNHFFLIWDFYCFSSYLCRMSNMSWVSKVLWALECWVLPRFRKSEKVGLDELDAVNFGILESWVMWCVNLRCITLFHSHFSRFCKLAENSFPYLRMQSITIHIRALFTKKSETDQFHSKREENWEKGWKCSQKSWKRREKGWKGSQKRHKGCKWWEKCASFILHEVSLQNCTIQKWLIFSHFRGNSLRRVHVFTRHLEKTYHHFFEPEMCVSTPPTPFQQKRQKKVCTSITIYLFFHCLKIIKNVSYQCSCPPTSNVLIIELLLL